MLLDILKIFIHCANFISVCNLVTSPKDFIKTQLVVSFLIAFPIENILC